MKSSTALELLAEQRTMDRQRLERLEAEKKALTEELSGKRRSLIKSVAFSAIVAGLFVTYLHRKGD